jgi:hypothetical protein
MQLFLTAFERAPDPRAENSRHDLIEILLIWCPAVLCGARHCSEMAAFGRAKLKFLETLPQTQTRGSFARHVFHRVPYARPEGAGCRVRAAGFRVVDAVRLAYACTQAPGVPPAGDSGWSVRRRRRRSPDLGAGPGILAVDPFLALPRAREWSSSPQATSPFLDPR